MIFRQFNRNLLISNDDTEKDQVWIAQLDYSGDLSEVLRLFENLKPDGFTYRDGEIEVRIIASYQKVKKFEEQLTLDEKVKIKSLSAI